MPIIGLPINGHNNFGDGSDGIVTISSDTLLPSNLDGDYIIKQYKSLTINALLSTTNRCKGLICYVQNDLIIGTNGIAKSPGGAFLTPPNEDLYLKYYPLVGGMKGYKTVIITPRIGAAGGISITSGTSKGNIGLSALGQLGGGASGGAVGGFSKPSGAGAAATCYSGGAGGAGADPTIYSSYMDGSSNGGSGGSGGPGSYNHSAGGGAGNPGGSAGGSTYKASPGESRTGGTIIFIVGGNITINGKLIAPGGNGGACYPGGLGGGGGASGGGKVIVLYAGTYFSNGEVSAVGGKGGSSFGNGWDGGDGGNGSIVIQRIAGL